jgi:hypothetical protein
MKTVGTFVASALFALLVVTPVQAQQPGTSDPHHPAPPAGSSAAPAPAPTPGTAGGGMPMMDMCRQMMTDMMMGMPMTGGGGPMDPKERAAMLQMRGEMMKAMGEIMMKHARRMQGPTTK